MPTTSITLPMPIPQLTRLHSIDESEDKIEEVFDAFTKEHITLLILGNFEKSDLLLKNANQLCLQDGAHPKQRILWIKDVNQVAALREKLEKVIRTSFPEREIDFNNIRAMTLLPGGKKVTYLIYVDPAQSDKPSDKRKKLSTFQMARAFNAAIKALPDLSTNNPINPLT